MAANAAFTQTNEREVRVYGFSTRIAPGSKQININSVTNNNSNFASPTQGQDVYFAQNARASNQVVINHVMLSESGVFVLAGEDKAERCR